MTYQLTKEAENDLEELVDYIAQDNKAAAENVREQLLNTIDRLDKGELPARNDRLKGVRRPVKSWLYEHWRIFFEEQTEGIVVLRIYHGRRKPITRR